MNKTSTPTPWASIVKGPTVKGAEDAEKERVLGTTQAQGKPVPTETAADYINSAAEDMMTKLR